MIIKHAPKKSAAPAPADVKPKTVKEVPVEEEPKKRNLWEELDTEEDI